MGIAKGKLSEFVSGSRSIGLVGFITIEFTRSVRMNALDAPKGSLIKAPCAHFRDDGVYLSAGYLPEEGNFIVVEAVMIVSRINPFTGDRNVREMPISMEQLQRWHDGELIQNVFTQLSAGDREFIKTGITEESWEEAFSE